MGPKMDPKNDPKMGHFWVILGGPPTTHICAKTPHLGAKTHFWPFLAKMAKMPKNDQNMLDFEAPKIKMTKMTQKSQKYRFLHKTPKMTQI